MKKISFLIIFIIFIIIAADSTFLIYQSVKKNSNMHYLALAIQHIRNKGLKNIAVQNSINQLPAAQDTDIKNKMSIIGYGEGAWHAVYRQLENALIQNPQSFGVDNVFINDSVKVKHFLDQQTLGILHNNNLN